MGTCCEYNRNNIDEGNLGGKIQYKNQLTRDDRIKSQNRDSNNTNSINDNLSALLDYQPTNNEKNQKLPFTFFHTPITIIEMTVGNLLR